MSSGDVQSPGGVEAVAGGVARVRGVFEAKRSAGRRTIMPFICAGHPTPDATGPIIEAVARAGAGIVEVGFPFSDPIADGPVIASAMDRALAQGATPDSVFETIAGVRERVSVGLIAMVSVSIVHRLGGAVAFVDRATQAGFDGFIFPDVPFEESGAFVAAASAQGRSASLLVAPTSSDERAAAIAGQCTGFVYALARSGITGERGDVPDLRPRVEVLRRATAEAIAVGFGISNAEQAKAVCDQADAAIVGSALVRRLDGASDPARVAGDFVGELVG